MTPAAPRPAFTLDPHLAADTLPVGDLDLCRVLLMNDARFPWLILVPRRERLVEIVDLPPSERAMLMDEIARCSQALRDVSRPEKLNVGALGNRVAQLHVHVIGRFRDDAAWPDPVWGRGAPQRYEDAAGPRLAASVRVALRLDRDRRPREPHDP
ncbi:MAG TPA: HIT domain-containing protein [Lichenihabitans sp.]|jgi:diadenosine tetraphosphate (Ap4A) HIT family hydrolase|nr:HIT domain-containing protein [Lichenihabitans sp.]